MEIEQHVTISKAASILNCSAATLRRLDQRGVFRGQRDFRGWRVFSIHDVMALKAARERLTGEAGLDIRLALLKLKQHLEAKIGATPDHIVSKKLDCVIFLLEN